MHLMVKLASQESQCPWLRWFFFVFPMCSECASSQTFCLFFQPAKEECSKGVVRWPHFMFRELLPPERFFLLLPVWGVCHALLFLKPHAGPRSFSGGKQELYLQSHLVSWKSLKQDRRQGKKKKVKKKKLQAVVKVGKTAINFCWSFPLKKQCVTTKWGKCVLPRNSL